MKPTSGSNYATSNRSPTKSLEVYLTGYQDVSRKHLFEDFLHGFRLLSYGSLGLMFQQSSFNV